MATARLFQSGGSQAVRLPKEFRFDGEEVEIFRRGDEVVLREKPISMARAFELITMLAARDRRQKRWPAAEAKRTLMPRYLLDTNTVIYIRQRRPPAVFAKFAALSPGEATLVGDYLRRTLCTAWRKAVIGLLALAVLQCSCKPDAVMPLPAEAGEALRRYSGGARARRNVIGNNDLWIAAHARVAGLILVSNNLREFRRVAGLTLENWIA